MLTYKELTEKKLSKLNQQHVGTVKDLETAMHSQGIDPGRSERDSHHVQYPKATFKKSGKPAHGITAVDDGRGRLTSSTGGNTVRNAVLKSGRVDKRPKAKAKRKEEAAANKERKAKQRNPFTREHTEWWMNAFRLDEGQQARARADRRMNPPQTKVNKQAGQVSRQNERAAASYDAKAPQRAEQLKRDQRAANDAAKSVERKVERDNRHKGERAAADAAAKSLERDVRAGANRPQSRPSSANKTTERTRAGGGALKVRTADDERRAKAMSVQSKRDAQEREARKPQAQPPRRPGQAEAEKKAKEGRIKSIEKKKTDKQMAKLGRDRQGPGGQLKSMAGGDMFIRDKKTDTQGTRDRKSSMRNKARGDFTKKKVQQTGNFVKSVPGKAGKYASNLAKSTRGQVGDSKASQVQGSSEIIRGSRS